MPEPVVLKSEHSRIRSYVLFRNCSERVVDVIWIGFNGEPVWYATLNPAEIKMINTFATHPWIFRDIDTGEKMHVRGREVYLPQPYHRGQLNRYLVPIQFPLRSLRANCLWMMASLLSQRPDRLNELELPRSLVQELRDVQQCIANAVEFRRRREADDDDDDIDGDNNNDGDEEVQPGNGN